MEEEEEDPERYREREVFLAKACELVGRFDGMRRHVVKIILASKEDKERVNLEERNLFAVAYRSLLSERRRSFRVLKETLERGSSKRLQNLENFPEEASQLLQEIRNEVIKLAKEALNFVEGTLMHQAHCAESTVYYLKLQADYHRYIAEVEDDKLPELDLAQKKYEEARVQAHQGLTVCHPLTLSLALNYSVFLYENMHDNAAAIKLASETIATVEAMLETVPDESKREVNLSLQILRDNLEMWTSHEGKQ